MASFGQRSIVVSLVLSTLLTAVISAAVAEQPAAALRVSEGPETISIADGTGPLFVYRHAGVDFKPYVEKLFTPGGNNILLDSPADHIHHHALMFAIAVDDVGFWAEFPDRNPGTQKQLSIESFTKSLPNGASAGGITGKLEWVTAKQEHLLSERRTVEVYRAEDLDATLLTWATQFEPAPGRDSVTLSGLHYYGLGLRMIESMNKVGKLQNADDAEGELVRANNYLVRSAWCAYTAPVDSKPVTVALFDHPTNPRHPATMFYMTEPFAYLGATLNLSREPLPLKSGQTLSLKYGVAVWEGAIEPDGIKGLYEHWVKVAGK